MVVYLCGGIKMPDNSVGMPRNIFALALSFTMNADPWPFPDDPGSEKEWIEYMNDVALSHGHKSWVEAYHRIHFEEEV